MPPTLMGSIPSLVPRKQGSTIEFSGGQATMAPLGPAGSHHRSEENSCSFFVFVAFRRYGGDHSIAEYPGHGIVDIAWTLCVSAPRCSCDEREGRWHLSMPSQQAREPVAGSSSTWRFHGGSARMARNSRCRRDTVTAVANASCDRSGPTHPPP